MKKSIIAVVAAALVAVISIPAISGCSAETAYVLKQDANGNGYYSVCLNGSKLAMNGELIIPSEYEGLPVKEIEPNSFSNTKISKVVIPSTVEVIGTAAFAYNNALQEVVFEGQSSLREISWGLFANCANLVSIVVPDSVKTVDGLAFYGCGDLSSVTLPEGLERINYGAFNGCESLASVTLPQSLTTIGSMAFYRCLSLESIILPDGMHDVSTPSLDENGEEKKDAEGNTVMRTVPAVGEGAFVGCAELALAVLGNGITSIEAGTFADCSSLSELYLPSSLKEVKGMFSSGSDYYGHAFCHVGALKVYYAGTEEEWEEVSIDETDMTYKEDRSDNSALVKAEKVYNTVYGG